MDDLKINFPAHWLLQSRVPGYFFCQTYIVSLTNGKVVQVGPTVLLSPIQLGEG